jgi:hypothetical protein
VIRLFGSAAVLLHLPACGDNAGDKVFSAADLNLLNQLADVIIPPDDQPGGSKLGAIAYIERLLTAFDTAIPKIYAGGPFSDRSGASTNDFQSFVELDRVSAASWTQTVPMIKSQLVDGLAAARAMKISDPAALYDQLPDDFRTLIFELVTEAAWAAPEYGGNPNLAGWKMIHFEGDSLPQGYSQWNGTSYDERADSPMSTPNPSDPEPLTDDIHMLLVEVVMVLGGRIKT